MGYTVNVDDALINEVSQHLRAVAEQEGKPLGVPREYDEAYFKHQVPGGMISNFKAQLAQAGLSHKLDEILDECARVRQELGWPIMITPFSQYVGILALLNVVRGDRYQIIPDEVKKYALGYNGKLLAPIEPGVLDRIIANGSQAIPLQPPPLEPAVPALRKKYPNMSDDERLLRYSYAGSQVDDMLAAGAIMTEYQFEEPWLRLLMELRKHQKFRHIYVESKGLRLELNSPYPRSNC